MASNLRVGGTRAYQPYREVEPVPPYPRINSQQSRDEYSGRDNQSQTGRDDHSRRRFRAMRRLIDALIKTQAIARVNHVTAEQELKDLGLALAEARLPNQLLSLNFSVADLEKLSEQIRLGQAETVLQAGEELDPDSNPFPIFVPGLLKYHFCLLRLRLPAGPKNRGLSEDAEGAKRYAREQDGLRLELGKAEADAGEEMLEMDIRIRVATCEIDPAGRRVILYQRPDRSFALYADKQINISI